MAENDILELLSSEHRHILRLLGVLDRMRLMLAEGASVDLADFRRVLRFLRFYLGEVHHGKEEKLLFPLLESSECTQGGPLCTLFMDQRINSSPIAPIMAIIKSSGYSIHSPPLRPELKRSLEKNSFLGIPLEEHEAGFSAVAYMEVELQRAEEQGRKLGMVFSLFLIDYLRLLNSHVRKEEECLFVLVQSKIPRIILAELAERAQVSDQALGMERMRACLEDLRYLEERYLPQNSNSS